MMNLCRIFVALVTLAMVGALCPPATMAAPKSPTADVKRASAPAKAARPAVSPSIGKDMVWVNTESKIYHKSGSYWYGKTRQGRYMTEAGALRAGYRPAGSKEK